MPANAPDADAPPAQADATPNVQALAFRAAIADDLPGVVALVESAYRGEASRAGWTTEADLLEGQRTSVADLAPLLDRARSRVLLAFREGSLVACAHVAVEDDAGYFGMFAVVPVQQCHGIGSKVLAEAERIAAAEWSCASMRMTVIDVRDDLIPYYERRGYRRTGIRKPFPYGDARFGQPLRDDLRFEVLEKTLGPAP
jgi:ribosomal protein S18 acetylase RimI-like enzyme